ncbi:Leucyl/phenylalanyl-tRNA protein transferase [Limnospira platensis C1]|nr:Leucyl/phenylalanyl-tRNA protein transferase [Arthrospira platensis C1]
MVKLVEHLQKREFCLFDAQMNNPHLERFGAFIVSKKKYNQLLSKALKKGVFLINKPRRLLLN